METRRPFSQEDLNEIFRISPNRSDRLVSRENTDLEFKESFGWQSLPMYLKTCASFANAKGGYLVFGVTNSPHILVGLSGASLKLFQDFDPEKMTESFNEHFSPEIIWDLQEHELGGKTFGLVFVSESVNKPVMCIRSLGQDLHEGDIYYRYRARSERIKYPELKSILEARREHEEQLWMKHLESISRIGVRDVGLLDLRSGVVAGSGGAFLIEESLLSQLAFIKEGEFSEVNGKPTLKLIGNVQSMAGAPVAVIKGKRVVTKGVHLGDIVLSFLEQLPVTTPLDYVKQICFETTAFLPIFYFMNKAGLDRARTIEILRDVMCRSNSKAKLIQRLEAAASQPLPQSAGTNPSTKKKIALVTSLRREEVSDGLSGKDLELCLQAIRSLSRDDIGSHFDYLRKLLRTWFDKYYSSTNPTMADYMRRAICWVDEALYDGGDV